ncbi:FAD-binding protein [Candidatus Gracilibacteria bacterium]|nr:FAD-binding protein [Candidatus Gracilibacteria bacterium]
MNRHSVDILIVGGGAAGLRAALAAAENYPQLRIGLISKVYPVRSHTVSAEGGIAGVMREYDSHEQHCFDTIRGSDYLADQDAVDFFVTESPKEIIQMEHWGCPWSREEGGKIAVRAFGGMSVKRTVYAADKTGFYMLHSLFERTLKYENIIRFDEWFVTKLITEHQTARSVVAIHLPTGEISEFAANAIILATGGAGKVYAFTTNAGIKTGDGMALAYNAGVGLKDMEFVQFHPTGLPRTGILITEGARGEGGYLLNNKGERFMKDYLPTKMELGPRDIISRSIISEIKAGRGWKGPYGSYVHLDIRHLGEKIINERLPLVRECAMDFAGIDPIKEPIPVMPVAHYFMGGVDTDKDAKTNIAGLFAAGETACVSMNGANRLGSNSLAECLVFGRVAGEQAAEFSIKQKKNTSTEASAEARNEEQRILKLLEKKGTESLASVREDLQSCMQDYVSIERDEKTLQAGITKFNDIKKRAEHIGIHDSSRTFNTDLTGYLELQNMMIAAEAVILSAAARKESRGSHFRTDHLERDDANYLHHSLAVKSAEGAMQITKKPVTITKWKPQARAY